MLTAKYAAMMSQSTRPSRMGYNIRPPREARRRLYTGGASG